MKTCPLCEGRKVVGRLIRGEMPQHIAVAGVAIPMIGEMHDQQCGMCKGAGVLPDDHTQFRLAGQSLKETDP